ncbi:hypothetical protein DY000_02006175 [Brassica cretica]|uniref:Uncharacterized protein n=1 Tax=Brassica cretica TaxID=69181 RepID=A0ABQ7C842_BRACR|nr:hypothetical protein DY000_02006175 [Brassica cretica]
MNSSEGYLVCEADPSAYELVELINCVGFQFIFEAGRNWAEIELVYYNNMIVASFPPMNQPNQNFLVKLISMEESSLMGSNGVRPMLLGE